MVRAVKKHSQSVRTVGSFAIVWNLTLVKGRYFLKSVVWFYYNGNASCARISTLVKPYLMNTYYESYKNRVQLEFRGHYIENKIYLFNEERTYWFLTNILIFTQNIL